MNRRRFLSCGLVPFVPVAAVASAAPPLWAGLDGACSVSEYYAKLLQIGVFRDRASGAVGFFVPASDTQSIERVEWQEKDIAFPTHAEPLIAAMPSFVSDANARWVGIDGASSVSKYHERLLKLGVYRNENEMRRALNALPLPWER